MRSVAAFALGLLAVVSGCRMDGATPSAPSRSSGNGLAACAASLAANATQAPDSGFSVNVFRQFKSYPPRGSESGMDDADLAKSFDSAIPLPLSEQCLQSNLFDFYLHDGSELNKGGNSDLKPVAVRSLNGSYHVVFLRNGYFSVEGEGNELVASLALYGLDGTLERSVDRVSSWRTFEGSLFLRESCISGAGISIRELAFDPDVRSPDGLVASYAPPDVFDDQVMYPDGSADDFLEGGQKIDCNWSNYVGLQRSLDAV